MAIMKFVYGDLGLVSKSSKPSERKRFLNRIMELGWSVIAWNQNFSGNLNINTMRPNPIVELTYPLEDSVRRRRLVCGVHHSTELTQLSRITYIVDEMNEAQNLSNPVFSSYDIVAAQASNQKLFAYLCKSAEIDIIVINFARKIPFPIDKKLLDVAVSRGICFELIYGSILNNNSARREIFANASIVIEYLRGKNIIFSSGVDNLNAIRGPADVCNVAEVLGLSRQQALECNAKYVSQVVQHSIARKYRKYSAFSIGFLTEVKLDDSAVTCIENECVEGASENSDILLEYKKRKMDSHNVNISKKQKGSTDAEEYSSSSPTRCTVAGDESFVKPESEDETEDDCEQYMVLERSTKKKFNDGADIVMFR